MTIKRRVYLQSENFYINLRKIRTTLRCNRLLLPAQVFYRVFRLLYTILPFRANGCKTLRRRERCTPVIILLKSGTV